VKSSTFQAKPMTVDQAVLQIDLMNGQFFVFQNVKDHTINVLYRRDDGNLGLIEALPV
jgi:putative sigma-54 modulation protein